MQTRIKIKSDYKNGEKMKSTKTINKYPMSDLYQSCPNWKAGILTTMLTVLAGIDNYNESSVYSSYGGLCLSHYRFVNKRCFSLEHHVCLFVFDIRTNCLDM